MILLDALDKTHVFGFNLYQCDDPTDDELVQETYERVAHIFEVLWLEENEEKFGVRVAQGIRNSTYTLIGNSSIYGCGMLEIPMLFEEDIPRAKMLAKLPPSIKQIVEKYWKRHEGFDKGEKADRADMVANKVEDYIDNPIFRRIVGQSRTTIDFRDIMDNGKILLVKLPGKFEKMTEILGAMIIAQILAASYARENQQKRRQFNIYADEFQRFATRDFAKLLTEASRKYNTPVTIAHQARDFIDLKNKAASMQVANLIILRVTFKDAEKDLAGNFDTTPPPPQQEEIGKEAVIVYKRDVVGHLLHQGLDNPAVEAFVSKHLQPLQRASQERPELNMRGGIAGKSVVYGKNKDVKGFDDIQEVFRKSDFLPSGKYLTNEQVGVIERFWDRFTHDNAGVYWYDPQVIHQDLLELNTFLYNAMRGNIADVEASVHTAGFLHGVGHWGLSAYLGFDTYYYINHCPISPQVKEAYLQIMNVTREYYKRWDVQIKLFGLSAFPKDEEEYQRLGEEFFNLEDQIEKIAVPSKLFYTWHEYRWGGVWNDNEQLLNREYQDAAFIDAWHTYFGGRRGETTYYSNPNREPGKWLEHYQFKDFYNALAHAFTNYACLQGVDLPDIPKGKQREVRRLMQQKWEIALRRAYLSGVDPKDQSGTAYNQRREWINKEIQPWLKPLFRDANACDLSVKAQVYDAEKNRYRWFIESLLATVEALKQDPISTRESGKYEVNMRPGLQLSSAEMQARIANELSNLPNYIARIRITNEAEELVEHIIKTLPPDKGLDENGVEKRITRIKQHMVDVGYYRAKTEVDAEISKRHEVLSQNGHLPQRKTSRTVDL